jgi:coenzyme Q-binding protein COQ10
MPSFHTVRRVAYPPSAMLDLVADVVRYPEFVPLCESLKVMSRTDGPDGTSTIVARMTVGYGPIHESFTSKVVVAKAAMRIDVTYLDGPFRSLRNRWLFKPAGDPAQASCDVDFDIVYEFRSLPLQLLLGAMFDRAFRKFAEAFEARAAKIYGAPQSSPPSVPNVENASSGATTALRPAR